MNIRHARELEDRFGLTFSFLHPEEQRLLGLDVQGIMDDERRTAVEACRLLSERIHGRKNLESYAQALVAGSRRRSDLPLPEVAP